MAIYKEVHLDNGAIFNYHRIVSVTMVVNTHNIIEIHSYVSREQREKEIEEIKNGCIMTVYREVKYVAMEYVQDDPLIKAYEYIKTLPEFEGSVDIFETDNNTNN